MSGTKSGRSKIKHVDNTPSVHIYLMALNMIIDRSTNWSDTVWAKKERDIMHKKGLIRKSGDTYEAVRGAKWD